MVFFKDRVPYSTTTDRPPLKLPGDTQIIVWTIINIEEWGSSGAMPRAVLPPPMGKPFTPGLSNWTWHGYGMGVGF